MKISRIKEIIREELQSENNKFGKGSKFEVWGKIEDKFRDILIDHDIYGNELLNKLIAAVQFELVNNKLIREELHDSPTALPKLGGGNQAAIKAIENIINSWIEIKKLNAYPGAIEHADKWIKFLGGERNKYLDNIKENDKGSIKLKKDTSDQDIKKYTEKGFDVEINEFNRPPQPFYLRMGNSQDNEKILIGVKQGLDLSKIGMSGLVKNPKARFQFKDKLEKDLGKYLFDSLIEEFDLKNVKYDNYVNESQSIAIQYWNDYSNIMFIVNDSLLIDQIQKTLNKIYKFYLKGEKYSTENNDVFPPMKPLLEHHIESPDDQKAWIIKNLKEAGASKEKLHKINQLSAEKTTELYNKLENIIKGVPINEKIDPSYTLNVGKLNLGNNYTLDHLAKAIAELPNAQDILVKLGNMESNGDVEILYITKYGKGSETFDVNEIHKLINKYWDRSDLDSGNDESVFDDYESIEDENSINEYSAPEQKDPVNHIFGFGQWWTYEDALNAEEELGDPERGDASREEIEAFNKAVEQYKKTGIPQVSDHYLKESKQTKSIYTDLKWSGIDHKDHPDYVDSYIMGGKLNGKEMSEDEIEAFNNSEAKYEELMKHLY